MNERERIIKMLHRERTDLLPWATRLDIWYTSRLRTGTLPAELIDMDLMDIHRYLGVGRQRYISLIATQLRGVDVKVEFNGTILEREYSPVMNFPVPRDRVKNVPGETVITFKTPAGQAQLCFRTTEELIRDAAAPYLVKHILAHDDDFPAVKWILNRLEILPNYEEFQASEALIGDDGFTIGMIERVPFQRILLDFMGEERTIYAMKDDSKIFRYLLDILTEHGRQALDIALDSPALMIELPDNFDGMITSPKLFQTFCIPYMQEVAHKVHAKGRFLGSHMDGNMKPLLHLVPESGIDVVESFSPAPLTQLTFAEAWEAWRGKVLMWGAIPSPIFEAHVPEDEFRAWVHEMLELIGDDGHIILGIGDQAVGPTLMERIRWVSDVLGR